MSALSVLEILDRQIGNNYNAAPSYEQLQEARAAVAELIEADKAYDEAEFQLSRHPVGSTFRKDMLAKFREAGKRRAAALARVGGAA